nr:MAG TPA: hypothetical protein [Caudoviricetes sp.]
MCRNHSTPFTHKYYPHSHLHYITDVPKCQTFGVKIVGS